MTTEPPNIDRDDSETHDVRHTVLPLSPQHCFCPGSPETKDDHSRSPQLLPIRSQRYPKSWKEDLVALCDNPKPLSGPAGGTPDLSQMRGVGIESHPSTTEPSTKNSLLDTLKRDWSTASDISLSDSLPPSLVSGLSTPAADNASLISFQSEPIEIAFGACGAGDHQSLMQGEAENEDNEAAAPQTGAGVIVPDTTWAFGGGAEEDAGYETDPTQSSSTSLASSIRDYPFENGRRYHRYQQGSYNFPNEEREQNREDMKHEMVVRLCRDRLHFAPIGPNPQEMLDIGTGTGSWAIEMGDLYPTANILGIDLSPIQPSWVPPNVRFMVDDAEEPWLHPRNHFDYIHARHVVMAIRDWPKLFRRSLEHLRPGGWIEVQEIFHYPQTTQGTIDADHPVARYWGLIHQALGVLGIDFHAVAGRKLEGMMRDAGFVNIHERVLPVPIGGWVKNSDLKTAGRYWLTILEDGIQAIAMAPLTRGLRWSREEVELFLIQVRQAYANNTALMYMTLHITCGQKPEGY